MKRLLSIIVCLAVAVVLVNAQDQEQGVIVLTNLKGLNTKSGVFSLQPNELTVAHNIVYDQIGAYQKRKGYDSLSALAGMDSIVHGGLFAAFYEDGTQQLVVVADSAGVGYGGVYLSPLGSANIKDSATKIWDYWSVQNAPLFEQYRERIYIGNGSHRPIIYDPNAKQAQEFPLRRPAEPRIIPLNQSGPLHGEYIYRTHIITSFYWSHHSTSFGILSEPIRIDSGQVMLRDFSRPIRDSLTSPWRKNVICSVLTVSNDAEYWLKIDTDSCGYTSDGTATTQEIVLGLDTAVDNNAGATVDAYYTDDTTVLFITSDVDFTNYACTTSDSKLSITIDSTWELKVTRTKANPGLLDTQDSMFFVYEVDVDFNDTLKLDTLWFIDSTADADLGGYGGAVISNELFGKDSLGWMVYRYGAPRYLSAHKVNGDTAAYGVYGGWGDSTQNRIRGVAYIVTFSDPVLNLESDTGRACCIFKDTGALPDTDIVYEISIPYTPPNSGLTVNLYRSMIYAIGNDTLLFADTSDEMMRFRSLLMTQYTELELKHRTIEKEVVPFYVYNWDFFIDSLYLTKPILLARLDDTVRTYLDSMRYDSLGIADEFLRPAYRQVTSPPLMTGMFQFQSRLFAYDRNSLYYSAHDLPILGSKITEFQEWQRTDFDLGDGDKIVFAYPARDYILVWKNSKSYLVAPAEDGFFAEYSAGDWWPNIDYLGGIGCLSALSFVDAPEGYYYLSQNYVILEGENAQRSRVRSRQPISIKLDNFDKLSSDVKATAVAAYIPYQQKYLLSIPSLDTTWVWDNQAKEWSTWSFTISASALYRTESEVAAYPGDTLYFAKPGEATLYRYGTSETDNGDSVGIRFDFAPILTDRFDYTITDIGVWINSIDTGTNKLAVGLFNEFDSSVSWKYLPSFKDNRYILQPMPSSQAKYYQLGLSTAPGRQLDSTVFDRFDIHYIRQGQGLDE